MKKTRTAKNTSSQKGLGKNEFQEASCSAIKLLNVSAEIIIEPANPARTEYRSHLKENMSQTTKRTRTVIKNRKIFHNLKGGISGTLSEGSVFFLFTGSYLSRSANNPRKSSGVFD
jgi:hypothetical protein